MNLLHRSITCDADAYDSSDALVLLYRRLRCGRAGVSTREPLAMMASTPSNAHAIRTYTRSSSGVIQTESAVPALVGGCNRHREVLLGLLVLIVQTSNDSRVVCYRAVANVVLMVRKLPRPVVLYTK